MSMTINEPTKSILVSYLNSRPLGHVRSVYAAAEIGTLSTSQAVSLVNEVFDRDPIAQMIVLVRNSAIQLLEHVAADNAAKEAENSKKTESAKDAEIPKEPVAAGTDTSAPVPGECGKPNEPLDLGTATSTPVPEESGKTNQPLDLGTSVRANGGTL